MSSRTRNRLKAGITAFTVGAAAIALTPADASAFGMGGFGRLGGFGGMGGFGHMGGLGHGGGVGNMNHLSHVSTPSHIGAENSIHSTHTNAEGHSTKTADHTPKSTKPSNDDKLSDKTDKRPSSGSLPDSSHKTDSQPVSAETRNANADRPVGGGMYEKSGTGGTSVPPTPVPEFSAEEWFPLPQFSAKVNNWNDSQLCGSVQCDCPHPFSPNLVNAFYLLDALRCIPEQKHLIEDTLSPID